MVFDIMNMEMINMIDNDFKKLYEVASSLAVKNRLNGYVKYGHVGAALMTDKGNIYSGVAITCTCNIGFCAEHSAIAEMLKNNESRIVKIVAANSNTVVAPCGRCREFIRMVNEENMDAEVMVAQDNVVKLKELLPYAWTLDSFEK